MTTETLMTAEVCCCGNCEAMGHEKEILRPLTAQEISEAKARETKYIAEEKERENKAKEIAELKTSALAKLTALGLTEDEAKAIVG